MASGKKWSGMLTSNVLEDTGAIPVGKVATASINMVNLDDDPVDVRIYISESATPSESDSIEPSNLQIPGNGIYKLTGEIVGAGERIVLKASTSNVAARVTVFEEDE
ncbi:hypothetical protein SAMN05216326_12743 [Nitrosomonas marina]|uniref:Uncharacterized protein n=1 Tax=Nitrosomonas marina TaxID=917 RepID=A0A1I0EJ21_9PROT|nr:hypothetical protein [Nitrosomonas marina]SET44656.1 hypothetical protein SAMN05216326_12743 [Nitrosomonas marina]